MATGGRPNPVRAHLHTHQGHELVGVQVLHPGLALLVKGEAWERWEHDLGRVAYPQKAVESFITNHALWIQAKEAAKQNRLHFKMDQDAAKQRQLETHIEYAS